ncbi:MAG: hypothetical protein VW645_06055 [Betaproteobacteria bacterium]|jgi:hypothetical protein
MSQKHFDLYHREGAFPSADKTIISTAWGPIELQCNGTGDFLILLHGLQSSMEVWRETVRQLPRLRGDSLSREASKHHRLELNPVIIQFTHAFRAGRQSEPRNRPNETNYL